MSKRFDLPPPKFSLGDAVVYEVEAIVKETGHKLKSWERFTVVRISLEADSERHYYTYGITNDPCMPYYGGKGIQFIVNEDHLKEAT